MFYELNQLNKVIKIAYFYLNTQFIIPQLLYTRRFVLFILSQVGVFVVMILIDYALFELLNIPIQPQLGRATYHNISLFLLTLLTSIALKAFWDKINADYANSERQKENLKTELAFLRSQISPHFLFNVLNNIVAMVRLKSEELEDTVVQLSTLLQYMLYETDEEKVTLHNEAMYLESYIALQSQRFGSKIQIHKQLKVTESWQTIEPMLLIPFVENAFKHGYGMVENPVIEIKLEIKKNELLFEVNNKYNPKNIQKDRVSGIGLANVKRRLELLYPSQHRLMITERDGWFLVQLALHLKNSFNENKKAL
ncbi:sensor histidine kinase [Runella sp. SP2]|uniref:sensor histidine kinase n=1 Tax=Runella sp. SP2 TaxID=2268026 RepID=UPI0013DDB8DD|nr:histidine kinase [Runella sp. SP2]